MTFVYQNLFSSFFYHPQPQAFALKYCLIINFSFHFHKNHKKRIKNSTTWASCCQERLHLCCIRLSVRRLKSARVLSSELRKVLHSQFMVGLSPLLKMKLKSRPSARPASKPSKPTNDDGGLMGPMIETPIKQEKNEVASEKGATSPPAASPPAPTPAASKMSPPAKEGAGSDGSKDAVANNAAEGDDANALAALTADSGSIISAVLAFKFLKNFSVVDDKKIFKKKPKHHKAKNSKNMLKSCVVVTYRIALVLGLFIYIFPSIVKFGILQKQSFGAMGGEVYIASRARKVPELSGPWSLKAKGKGAFKLKDVATGKCLSPARKNGYKTKGCFFAKSWNFQEGLLKVGGGKGSGEKVDVAFSVPWLQGMKISVKSFEEAEDALSRP